MRYSRRAAALLLVGLLTLSQEIDRLVQMFEYEEEVTGLGVRCAADVLPEGGVLVRCQAQSAPDSQGPSS